MLLKNLVLLQTAARARASAAAANWLKICVAYVSNMFKPTLINNLFRVIYIYIEREREREGEMDIYIYIYM